MGAVVLGGGGWHHVCWVVMYGSTSPGGATLRDQHVLEPWEVPTLHRTQNEEIWARGSREEL